MTYLAIVPWWLLGTATLLWLQRGSPITWLRLTICIAFGWVGPAVVLGVVIGILTQAEFWHKPIFPRKER